eukprot:15482939-Alexandrium_andersonii.AAC.1
MCPRASLADPTSSHRGSKQKRRGRRAKRGDPGAQRRDLGVAGFPSLPSSDKDVSAFGPVAGRSLFHVEYRPLLSFRQ